MTGKRLDVINRSEERHKKRKSQGYCRRICKHRTVYRLVTICRRGEKAGTMLMLRKLISSHNDAPKLRVTLQTSGSNTSSKQTKSLNFWQSLAETLPFRCMRRFEIVNRIGYQDRLCAFMRLEMLPNYGDRGDGAMYVARAIGRCAGLGIIPCPITTLRYRATINGAGSAITISLILRWIADESSIA